VHPGRPLAGAEFLVRDLVTGEPAAPGVDGELFARGPTVFSGYHGRADLTEAAFDVGGWYRTGDLGMVDENGLLRFRGRLKDMLKIGGENVGAIEIESHLESHPDILLASVVGVPDDRLGEVAVAFVELRPGVTLRESDVIAHCEGRIASFKVPHHVRFVTEWPMSATKIAKDPLRVQILEDLGLGR
jgi:acyl-CoA synthetase (AMP-forming)/AMP-acid ligase II